jgi:transcriptional regulator with XRE-family HTH domain
VTVNTIDPQHFKKEVGERIKTVRTANGYKTRADLTQHFPDWSEGRLANYESGTSLPGPVDILRIAEQTNTNPCWILFGRGAMFSQEPDIHQIRRQNLARVCSGLDEEALQTLLRDLKIKSREFNNLLRNSTSRIGKTICRKVENLLELEKGSIDRQDFDQAQPEINMSPRLAELVAVFDGLDAKSQRVLLNLAKDLRDP